MYYFLVRNTAPAVACAAAAMSLLSSSEASQYTRPSPTNDCLRFKAACSQRFL